MKRHIDGRTTDGRTALSLFFFPFWNKNLTFISTLHRRSQDLTTDPHPQTIKTDHLLTPPLVSAQFALLLWKKRRAKCVFEEHIIRKI